MPEAEAATYRFHPFDSDQGVVEEGLPADRGRRVGAKPKPGELLRRCRAGCVQSGQRGARCEFLAGQDAAGAAVLRRRCAALPPRGQPPSNSNFGQGRQLRQLLPPRRPDARGCEPGRRSWHRAELIWPMGRAAGVPRASARRGRCGRPLQLPRGRRQRLRAARNCVPAHEWEKRSKRSSTTLREPLLARGSRRSNATSATARRRTPPTAKVYARRARHSTCCRHSSTADRLAVVAL